MVRLPWLDEMGCGKERTQEDADTADNDIGNAQERVPATHDSASGDEDRFRAVVNGDWKVFERVSIAMSTRDLKKANTHNRKSRPRSGRSPSL